MRACLVDIFLLLDALEGERIVCFLFMYPKQKDNESKLIWEIRLPQKCQKTLGLESRMCLNLFFNILTYNLIKMQSNR